MAPPSQWSVASNFNSSLICTFLIVYLLVTPFTLRRYFIFVAYFLFLTIPIIYNMICKLFFTSFAFLESSSLFFFSKLILNESRYPIQYDMKVLSKTFQKFKKENLRALKSSMFLEKFGLQLGFNMKSSFVAKKLYITIFIIFYIDKQVKILKCFSYFYKISWNSSVYKGFSLRKCIN